MTSEPERELFRAVKADDLPWRPSAVAAGVHVKDLAASDGWQMQLVRCEPGARFPVHTHAGPEFLFILEGELVQGDGAWARAGRAWPARDRSTTTCARTPAASSSSSSAREDGPPHG